MTKKKNKIQVPDFVVKEFGTTLEDIYKSKSNGKQTRGTLSPEKPEIIQMSMDECKGLCVKANVEYKAGYEERIIKYVCSSDRPDRMGDVIKQDGWDLNDYNKNPVVMGFHDYSTFPVGKSLKTFVEDGKLKMWILFADKDVNEDADKAFKMCKSGFMTAGSVGFSPVESKMPNKEEREALGMPAYGTIFNKQSLLEYSVCGVPANADALQESISKGLFKKEEFKGWVNDETYTKLIEIPDSSEVKLENEPEQKEFNDSFSEGDILKLKEIIKGEAETKSGAVLSKKTINKMTGISEAMKTAVDMIDELLNQNSKTETEQETESKSSTPELIEIYFDELEENKELESDLYTSEEVFEIELNQGDK